MKVEDAVVFVTGANLGIGLAFARQALALGAAKVYASMRNTDGVVQEGRQRPPCLSRNRW